MFDRFTSEARAIMVDAAARARELGHNWIGCEHLLLAVSATDAPAGEVLRASGITPRRIEQTILGTVGRGRGRDFFDTLDREALAAIGIDLDKVRQHIEKTFGPQFSSPAPTPCGQRRPPWPRRRKPPRGNHIPFTPRAKECLEHTAHEAGAARGGHIGLEHVALAVVSMKHGAVPGIVRAIGTNSARLRAEILDSYRQAG